MKHNDVQKKRHIIYHCPRCGFRLSEIEFLDIRCDPLCSNCGAVSISSYKKRKYFYGGKMTK